MTGIPDIDELARLENAVRALPSGYAFVDAVEMVSCTCPSGDGSLRWPCPVHHPPTDTCR